MRLFVAFLLPEDIRAALIRQRNKVGEFLGCRWVAPDALHVTLKFLGETDESKVIDIQELLTESAMRFNAFSLYLEGGGMIPDRQRPRVLWTSLKGETEPLRRLATHLEQGFQACGFPIEERDYTPHVTLGRIKPDRGYGGGPHRPEKNRESTTAFMTGIDQFCTLFANFKSDMFSVREIHLMESQLSSQGAQYRSRRGFPLGGL